MISHKWGRILNCSSIGIKIGGGKNSFNYSLSKHCLEFIPNSYKFWAENNVFINKPDRTAQLLEMRGFPAPANLHSAASTL